MTFLLLLASLIYLLEVTEAESYLRSSKRKAVNITEPKAANSTGPKDDTFLKNVVISKFNFSKVKERLNKTALNNTAVAIAEKTQADITADYQARTEADVLASSLDNEKYVYSLETDCYNGNITCDEGYFCQVESRDNWYPYAISYIDRGRCLPYQTIGGACYPMFQQETAFPRQVDGGFFKRSTLCSPGLTCTGDTIFVLPSQCVIARNASLGCQSSKADGCAGRSSAAECPDGSFCFFPRNDKNANHMTKKKLEQCAAIVTSFNGPSFGIQGKNGVRPDDNYVVAGDTAAVTKRSVSVGFSFAPQVQKFLQTLWPYPICDEKTKDKCTIFPLPVPSRDNDGGLIGGKCINFTDSNDPLKYDEVNCTDVSKLDMSFLDVPGSSSGAIDYHCTWAILHTLTLNGNDVLTYPEQQALLAMIIYISGQFDCKEHLLSLDGHPSQEDDSFSRTESDSPSILLSTRAEYGPLQVLVLYLSNDFIFLRLERRVQRRAGETPHRGQTRDGPTSPHSPLTIVENYGQRKSRRVKGGGMRNNEDRGARNAASYNIASTNESQVAIRYIPWFKNPELSITHLAITGSTLDNLVCLCRDGNLRWFSLCNLRPNLRFLGSIPLRNLWAPFVTSTFDDMDNANQNYAQSTSSRSKSSLSSSKQRHKGSTSKSKLSPQQNTQWSQSSSEHQPSRTKPSSRQQGANHSALLASSIPQPCIVCGQAATVKSRACRICHRWYCNRCKKKYCKGYGLRGGAPWQCKVDCSKNVVIQQYPSASPPPRKSSGGYHRQRTPLMSPSIMDTSSSGVRISSGIRSTGKRASPDASGNIILNDTNIGNDRRRDHRASNGKTASSNKTRGSSSSSTGKPLRQCSEPRPNLRSFQLKQGRAKDFHFTHIYPWVDGFPETNRDKNFTEFDTNINFNYDGGLGRRQHYESDDLSSHLCFNSFIIAVGTRAIPITSVSGRDMKKSQTTPTKTNNDEKSTSLGVVCVAFICLNGEERYTIDKSMEGGSSSGMEGSKGTMKGASGDRGRGKSENLDPSRQQKNFASMSGIRDDGGIEEPVLEPVYLYFDLDHEKFSQPQEEELFSNNERCRPEIISISTMVSSLPNPKDPIRQWRHLLISCIHNDEESTWRLLLEQRRRKKRRRRRRITSNRTIARSTRRMSSNRTSSKTPKKTQVRNIVSEEQDYVIVDKDVKQNTKTAMNGSMNDSDAKKDQEQRTPLRGESYTRHQSFASDEDDEYEGHQEGEGGQDEDNLYVMPMMNEEIQSATNTDNHCELEEAQTIVLGALRVHQNHFARSPERLKKRRRSSDLERGGQRRTQGSSLHGESTSLFQDNPLGEEESVTSFHNEWDYQSLVMLCSLLYSNGDFTQLHPGPDTRKLYIDERTKRNYRALSKPNPKPISTTSTTTTKQNDESVKALLLSSSNGNNSSNSLSQAPKTRERYGNETIDYLERILIEPLRSELMPNSLHIPLDSTSLGRRITRLRMRHSIRSVNDISDLTLRWLMTRIETHRQLRAKAICWDNLHRSLGGGGQQLISSKNRRREKSNRRRESLATSLLSLLMEEGTFSVFRLTKLDARESNINADNNRSNGYDQEDNTQQDTVLFRQLRANVRAHSMRQGTVLGRLRTHFVLKAEPTPVVTSSLPVSSPSRPRTQSFQPYQKGRTVLQLYDALTAHDENAWSLFEYEIPSLVAYEQTARLVFLSGKFIFLFLGVIDETNINGKSQLLENRKARVNSRRQRSSSSISSPPQSTSMSSSKKTKPTGTMDSRPPRLLILSAHFAAKGFASAMMAFDNNDNGASPSTTDEEMIDGLSNDVDLIGSDVTKEPLLRNQSLKDRALIQEIDLSQYVGTTFTQDNEDKDMLGSNSANSSLSYSYTPSRIANGQKQQLCIRGLFTNIEDGSTNLSHLEGIDNVRNVQGSPVLPTNGDGVGNIIVVTDRHVFKITPNTNGLHLKSTSTQMSVSAIERQQKNNSSETHTPKIVTSSSPQEMYKNCVSMRGMFGHNFVYELKVSNLSESEPIEDGRPKLAKVLKRKSIMGNRDTLNSTK
eukprot:g1009.t1